MDEQAIKAAVGCFRNTFPDFRTFGECGQNYHEGEDDYKRKAVTTVHEKLGPYVEGKKKLASDGEARQLVMDLANSQVTNLVSWRDTRYLGDEVFSEEGNWLQFMSMMLSCLRNSANDGWKEHLDEMLRWLVKLGCAANVTKVLPTYFLYLWDPEHHIFIKPSACNRFLCLTGERIWKKGEPMTLVMYERVLEVFGRVRQAIGDLAPRDFIDLQSFYWVVDYSSREGSGPTKENKKKEQKGGTEHEKTSEQRKSEAGDDKALPPLNLILAGPPGTGKTYRLFRKYAPMFEEAVVSQSKDDFIREQCADLRWIDVVILGLILQGGKARVPELVESVPVRAKAARMGRTGPVNATVWVSLQNYTAEGCPNVKGSVNFQPGVFWKDEDSTWRFIEEARDLAPELFELADKIQAYKPTAQKVRRHEFVTFHQSYSYEDFVEGIKPVLGGEGDESQAVGYEVVDGIFKRMPRRAMEDPGHRYALFIDEINRGNIANIFGELITLIEDDKRMTWDRAGEEWVGDAQVKLPYTHSTKPASPLFGVPENLHIIGTMNTADRSIALMDHALRRRFTFEEVMPDTDVLARECREIQTEDGPILLNSMMEKMNQRIEYLLDRDHTIGHSYFLRVDSLETLEQVFRERILPLLQEYFHADWEKIQLVLGDLKDASDAYGRRQLHPDAIVRHQVLAAKDLFGFDDEILEPRPVYEIAEELSARSFRKIYQEQ